MCGRGWGGGLKRDLEQEKGASCVRTSADFLEVSCDGMSSGPPQVVCVCVRVRVFARAFPITVPLRVALVWRQTPPHSPCDRHLALGPAS